MLIEKELYERINKETITDYEGVLVKKEEYYYVEPDNIISMLEDLYYEIDHWKEQYEDLKRDLEENYKHIPYEEQI